MKKEQEDNITPNYEAFFVPPLEADRGKGVLVLPSKWGVTKSIKDYCIKLSDLGYSVMAPQILPGPLPIEEETANEILKNTDPNYIADAVVSCIHTLRTYTIDSTKPISIIGFGMGASLSLWASERMSESVNLCVAYYGTQDIDYKETTCDYVLHFGKKDKEVTEDDAVFSYSSLMLTTDKVEVNWYDAEHDFCETMLPNYNKKESDIAWKNTLAAITKINS